MSNIREGPNGTRKTTEFLLMDNDIQYEL